MPVFRQPLFTLAVVVVLLPRAAAEPPSVPISDYRLVRIDGRTDVIRMADDKLERLDGGTFGTVWKRGLTAADQPQLAKFKTGEEDDPTATLRYVRRVLTTGPDLTGDGKGDCVFGLDFQPDLVAVDGTTGDVLWWHRNRPRPDGMREGPYAGDQVGQSFVLAEPLAFDADGDGVPDLITGFNCAGVTYRDVKDREKVRTYPSEAVVQAVSGRTGKPLWTFRLDDTLFERPVSSDSFLDYSQTLGTWKGEPTVTAAAAGRAWTLKVRTGEAVGPAVKLPARSPRTFKEHPRLFDPDGTGELAVLTVTGGKETQTGPGDPTPHLIVTAVRIATGEVLWEVEHAGLTLEWRPQQEANAARACDWPAPFRPSAKADDKREDVLLPFKRAGAAGAYWHGVERLDGRTGRSVWRRRILVDEDANHDHLAIARLTAGPDLTGDGCQELFAVFGVIDPTQRNATTQVDRVGTPTHERVCVTALSGADGGLLWQRQMPDGLKRAHRGTCGFAPLQWQRPAADARPQLVVPRVDPFDGTGCFTWVVEPATGFVRDSLQGLEWIDAPDGREVFGHVPGSWNPRVQPDRGRLYRWSPALKTEAAEGGVLPAADAAVNLPTRAAFPWQERPLPWAGTRAVWWEAGGGLFVLLLAVAAVRRRWLAAVVLLVLVLLVSGGVSCWLLHTDAANMDPEESYTLANWYGVGCITATGFLPFAAWFAVVRAKRRRPL
jgi:outer membrane protein assembly factor BamB